MAMSGRLGSMLVSSGLITDDQLKKALSTQKTEGGRLGSILVKLGFVQEDKLMTFLSKQYGVPYVDLSKFQINPAVIKHIPADSSPEIPHHADQPLRRHHHHRHGGPLEHLRHR